MTETITGTDRSAGVSLTELLGGDTGPVSDVLRAESREGLRDGNTRSPAWYYTSPEFHALEVEKLWSRVWQMACLEEEIPDVGDYHVYEIADMSFLIVRTEEGIKAFRNACLHRGRLLRESDGKGAKSLRCAFHGWNWELDGALKEIPCEWDFPSIRKEDYSLPQASVGTWDGFVFINPDRDAEPLAEYLAGFDEHFAKYPFARKVKTAHVEKIMRCNWKACQEAFMEAYHVVATHPTLMQTLGDANTRYDTWGNYSRAISPQQIDSPHLANMPKWEVDPDGKQFVRYRHPMNGHIYERTDVSEPAAHSQVRVIDLDGHESYFESDGTYVSGPITQADPHLLIWVGGPSPAGVFDVPIMGKPDTDSMVEARSITASARRDEWRQKAGGDLDPDAFADAEFVDAIWYSVFPNWSPWGVFNALHYRFRPNGNDPDTCIFEVMMFVPWGDQANRPAPAKVTKLGPDDDWTLATELGATAKIFQQDSVNLPHVQRGLKAQEQQEVIFANYNETKIRHFWEHLHHWLEIGQTNVSITPR
ncbi:MAG: aromatic ring-hydroxylating oxygenase subunit alpha [Ilumatobacter sp.]|uniref:aromatic ring-hydroxylating oxygenase subunit alpha n=1 Tax=Ilumatobacter sp. TaxID=1967498 RepID=UPI00391C2EFD